MTEVAVMTRAMRFLFSVAFEFDCEILFLQTNKLTTETNVVLKNNKCMLVKNMDSTIPIKDLSF